MDSETKIIEIINKIKYREDVMQYILIILEDIVSELDNYDK